MFIRERAEPLLNISCTKYREKWLVADGIMWEKCYTYDGSLLKVRNDSGYTVITDKVFTAYLDEHWRDANKWGLPITEMEHAKIVGLYIKLLRDQTEHIHSLFHIPNEAKRTYQQSGGAKAQGMLKGVPDYLYCRPSAEYTGYAFELKRKYPSPVLSHLQQEQLAIMRVLSHEHWNCFVAFGCYSAINIIAEALYARL